LLVLLSQGGLVNTFKEQLIKMDACGPAIKWVGKKDLQEAWKTCERADWMLWLSANMIGEKGWSSHKEIVAVCCDIAESVLYLVPEGEDRPRKAIETTRRWIAGEATLDDVLRAADDAVAADAAASWAAINAAYAAANDASAYAAATWAADDAAGGAANDAAAAAAAAYAAATWASAAASAYADWAAATARKQKHIEMCQLIRSKLTIGEMI
jgi:hypothetical protein